MRLANHPPLWVTLGESGSPKVRIQMHIHMKEFALLFGFGGGGFFSLKDTILHDNRAENGDAVAFVPTTAGN